MVRLGSDGGGERERESVEVVGDSKQIFGESAAGLSLAAQFYIIISGLLDLVVFLYWGDSMGFMSI